MCVYYTENMTTTFDQEQYGSTQTSVQMQLPVNPNGVIRDRQIVYDAAESPNELGITMFKYQSHRSMTTSTNYHKDILC